MDTIEMTYTGPERRERGDFEREVIGFMARIDQHMSDQKGRCDSHSRSIQAVEVRTSSLESSRDYAKGLIKTASVGLPAIGTICWCVWQVFKDLRGMR